MNLRTVSIVVVLAALALFALLNWGALSAPSELSLGFTTVQAPLGLVMLAFTGLIVALFFVVLVFQLAGWMVEARRHARELQAQRELADRAEASRFTELREFVASEMGLLRTQQSADTGAVAHRVQQLEERLAQRLDDATGSLSACVGEVDDKLDRLLPPPR